jgi:excisionase family DNA binding protein
MSLTAKEAAAYLGLDPKALRQKLRDGYIQGHQVGVMWRVEKAALDAYLAGTTEAPRQAFEAAEGPGKRQSVKLDAVTAQLESQPPLALSQGNYETLAIWTPWVSFAEAARAIPRLPGVYVARERQTGNIVYVGMAAERMGNGMRGRLAIYARGRGATSGLGEGAMDRALADPAWLRERLTEAEQGVPLRAKDLARAAVDRADLQMRWSSTADGPSASALEISVLRTFDGLPLWNRRR